MSTGTGKRFLRSSEISRCDATFANEPLSLIAADAMRDALASGLVSKKKLPGRNYLCSELVWVDFSGAAPPELFCDFAATWVPVS